MIAPAAARTSCSAARTATFGPAPGTTSWMATTRSWLDRGQRCIHARYADDDSERHRRIGHDPRRGRRRLLIGGAAGDRIDGGDERDLIFGDNVRLDRTIGDGMANARYRTLTGAEGGQIYSTLPGTAGTVLVNSASSTIPGGEPVWEVFNIELLDHYLATQTAGRQQLRQRLHRRRRERRRDLRRARQRHHPGRRLDRPYGRCDATRRRHVVRAGLGRRPSPTATTTSRATAATM